MNETTASLTSQPLARAKGRGRRANLFAVVLILLGVGYRLWLTVSLPVGYDEVFVMGVGLDEMADSTRALAIEVPITRSSAVTPLWWWLQYAFVKMAGGLSLWALRILPALLGIVTLPLAYVLARRAYGRRIALVFLALVSLSDILSFTNGRGEFAESAMMIFLIAGVCLMGRRRSTFARGIVWLALLMTSLGKGLLIVGLMVAGELAITARIRTHRGQRIRSLSAGLVIAVLPVLAYLLWANSYFTQTGLIHHEATDAGNVFELITKLTLGYAQVKEHVTGSVWEAVTVYSDFTVWPATMISGIFLVVGLLWALAKLATLRLRPRSRRDQAMLGLAAWTLVGALVVIGRGTLGARFHLLYLPPAWMLTAMWLGGRSCHATQARRLLRSVVGVAVIMGAVVCLAGTGPTRWAHFARFEPMPKSDEMRALNAYRAGEAPFPTPHGRTFFIDMANYYLVTEPVTQAHLEKALHYAQAEARRVPDDARAWAYVGEALYRLGPPFEQTRAAWERSLELAPNERLQQRLETLVETQD